MLYLSQSVLDISLGRGPLFRLLYNRQLHLRSCPLSIQLSGLSLDTLESLIVGVEGSIVDKSHRPYESELQIVTLAVVATAARSNPATNRLPTYPLASRFSSAFLPVSIEEIANCLIIHGRLRKDNHVTKTPLGRMITSPFQPP